MKIGQFDIKAWTYRGTKLALAHVILWRLFVFPFVCVTGWAMICFVALGWGLERAKSFREQVGV